MDKLDLAVGYLSGAMEYVSDHGIGWRRKFISLVKEAKLNIDLIDPTNKPGGSEMRIGEDKEYQNRLRQEKQWVKLQEYVSRYRRYDLRFVDICDFLVAAIDLRVPQWGTANEVYFAEMQHKPIFFLCEQGCETLPSWLFDLVDFDGDKPTNVFQTVEEIVDVLVQLNSGAIPLNKEWVLIRKFIEDSRTA